MATSTEIGDHLDLNPVVIRRLLGVLRSEGIVESRSGPKGGWAVARDLRPSRWEGSTASSRAIPKLLLRPRWTRRWWAPRRHTRRSSTPSRSPTWPAPHGI